MLGEFQKKLTPDLCVHNVHLPVDVDNICPNSDNKEGANLKPSAIQTEKELIFPSFDGVTTNFDEWFISVKNELKRSS